MKIICISGKAQHGKDTTAKILKARLEANGNTVLIAHFADTLKFVCKTFFDWDGEKDDAGRTLLQYVGTDVVRKRRPGFWVDFMFNILDLFKDSWDYVILPDCRYPNEITRMLVVAETVWHVRVVRPNFASPLTSEQQAHESETSLDHYPREYVVLNSGDLEALNEAAINLAEQIIDPEGALND